jgi:predicted short-subunit dehydrogenase-like oxidoreductase (DUF2520 family)
MKIVLIGSGNVATLLAEKFAQKGCSILQVVSQHEGHAQRLADQYHAPFSDFNGILNTDADIYIIALTDKGLNEYASRVKIPGKLVIHTAGSVSINVLKDVSDTHGVMYPLQTIRKGIDPPEAIPFLIDGSDFSVIQNIKSFAQLISKNIQEVKDEERFKLHLGAVMANNFSNFLFSIVENYCVAEKLDFDLLKPLIMETATRINDISPRLVQTGPAVRKDYDTIQKHLDLLKSHTALRQLYKLLSDQIGEHFNK